MGQQEIYNYLKKHKGWKTVTEIADAIKSQKIHVRRCLKQMLKYREVYCKEIKIHIYSKYNIKNRRVIHWKLV